MKVTIKENEHLKFNSELNTLTSSQVFKEIKTLVFFSNNSNEDSIAVFWDNLILSSLKFYKIKLNLKVYLT